MKITLQKLLFILICLGLLFFVWRSWMLRRPKVERPVREEISMTIIEGWNTQDITKALEDKGVDVQPSDFFADRFVVDAPFLNALPLNATLEGYLFPETYRVWKDELPDALFKKQLETFSERTQGFEEEAKKQGRSLNDVVILASIVEREVSAQTDRSIVAGIFMNRLKAGIPLQSDATVNYVTGAGRTRPTLDDLKSDSLYNTYRHAGLPPGPISNPSEASLQAALHPAVTPYHYFLTDPEGKIYFAKTLNEHIKNRNKAFRE